MKLPIVTLLAVTLGACSHAVREPRTTRPSRDSDVILAEELAGAQGASVYDAVRQFRPAWIMRSRPTALLQANQAQLIVYVDGLRYATGIESLRSLPIKSAA